MSVYSFRMNLTAGGGHSFQAPFSQPDQAGGKVGSQRGVNDMLDEDDEPVASDISAVLEHMKKDKKCEIHWFPDNGNHSFLPLKNGSIPIVGFLLFLSIKDKKDSSDSSFSYQVTLKGATVKDVKKDPRMGHEVVRLDMTSLEFERK
jgi:hypothetical protein